MKQFAAALLFAVTSAVSVEQRSIVRQAAPKGDVDSFGLSKGHHPQNRDPFRDIVNTVNTINTARIDRRPAAPIRHIDLESILSDAESRRSAIRSAQQSALDSAFSSEIESEFKNATLPGALGGRQRRLIGARFALRHGGYSEDDINSYLSDQSDRISDLNSLITDVGYLSDVDAVYNGLNQGRRIPGGSFIDRISLGYRSDSDIASDLASALDNSQLLGYPRILPNGKYNANRYSGIRILDKGVTAIVGGEYFLSDSDIQSELESRYSERQSYYDSLVSSDLDGQVLGYGLGGHYRESLRRPHNNRSHNNRSHNNRPHLLDDVLSNDYSDAESYATKYSDQHRPEYSGHAPHDYEGGHGRFEGIHFRKGVGHGLTTRQNFDARRRVGGIGGITY